MPLWPRPTDTVITDGDQNKQPTVAPPALAGTLLTLRFHHLYFNLQVCYIYSYCIVTKFTSQIRTRYFNDLQQNVLEARGFIAPQWEARRNHRRLCREKYSAHKSNVKKSQMTIAIGSHDTTARIADGQDRHRRGVTGRIGAEQDYENTSFILSPSISFLVQIHG